jgi:hypothetical protein
MPALPLLSPLQTRILELSGFPAALKTRDIAAVFAPYDEGSAAGGVGPGAGFKIKWVDDTTALIVFDEATTGECMQLGCDAAEARKRRWACIAASSEGSSCGGQGRRRAADAEAAEHRDSCCAPPLRTLAMHTVAHEPSAGSERPVSSGLTGRPLALTSRAGAERH